MTIFTLRGSAVPDTPATADAASVTVGFAFHTNAALTTRLTKFRFYRGTGNNGTHIGGLWRKDGASWTLLASETFASETASGWQEQPLATPLPLDPNTLYAAGVFMPVGRYALSNGGFPAANGPITAANPESDSVINGRFEYGPGLLVPADTFTSGVDYGVDIEYDDTPIQGSGIVFDPVARRIILDEPVVSAAVLWSRWVDWVATGDNSKYPPAFRNIGGDDLGGGLYVPVYYFLLNGWRVRPMEMDHTVTIQGNLFVDGGGVPVVRTLGAFNVSAQYTVPVQAQAFASGGGGASAGDIAAAVLAALQATTIPVNVEKMNNADVIGDGTVPNPWRGVGVSP